MKRTWYSPELAVTNMTFYKVKDCDLFLQIGMLYHLLSQSANVLNLSSYSLLVFVTSPKHRTKQVMSFNCCVLNGLPLVLITALVDVCTKGVVG